MTERPRKIERFEWMPSTLTRVSDSYYVLNYVSGELAASSKGTLERWARTHGFKVTSYVDSRKPAMKTGAFDTLYGEKVGAK